MKKVVAVLVFGFLVAGCANPLNQVTADRYGSTCNEAESLGHLDVAEEACRRALINTRIGHLGAEEESKSLYNLARIKQALGKVEEAEELLKESLTLEDSIKPSDQKKVGRRLTNLSIALAMQNRFKDAWLYLERLMPLSMQYEGQERQVVKQVFERYAEQYRKLGMGFESAQLLDKSKSL